MTLDQVQDNFSFNQDNNSAALLLTTGLQYWRDGMIDDSTLEAEIIQPVISWLKH